MLTPLKQLIRSVPGAQAGRALVRRAVLGPASVLSFRASGRLHHVQKTYSPALESALAGVRSQSDISDHLGVLFFLALQNRPRLMVELGTRGGASTRALLAAAAYHESTLLSLDIADCRAIGCPHEDRWKFVQADDVAFARDQFPAWCEQRGLPVRADLLFIDTSHEYAHTCQELAAWLPYVARGGSVVLHDTNMGRLYGRTDGSVGYGWDNRRGVIRALEEHLGRNYDESAYFCDLVRGFAVLHLPHCNGFTILSRVGPEESVAPRADR
jgi:cephalosporin hydroxylase